MTIALNAATPLNVPTYDGTGETVHVGVIDTHEVIGQNWQGHRYWMVHTPYANSNDSLENPSIVVSDDLISWVAPAGLTNPVVQPDASYTNTDGDIMLEPDGSQMHLVWRQTYPTGDVEHIRLVSSSDGITWSEPVTLFTSGDTTTALLELSPSLIKHGGLYHLYTVNAYDKASAGIGYRTASTVTGPWSAKSMLEQGYYNGEYTWHISVRVESTGTLRCVMNTSPFAVDRSRNGELWLAESPGPGQNINALVKLMEGVPGAWDAELYRSCVVPGVNNTWALFYSAYDGSGDWHIGLSEFDYDLPAITAATTAASAAFSGLVPGNYRVEVSARSGSGESAVVQSSAVTVSEAGTPVSLTGQNLESLSTLSQPTLTQTHVLTGLSLESSAEISSPAMGSEGVAVQVTINAQSTTDNTPTLTGTVSREDVTLSLEVNGEIYTPTLSGTTWTQTTATLPIGTRTATITATDSDGNTDSATAEITIEPTMAFVPMYTTSVRMAIDKLYVNTDVDIALTASKGFTLEDVSSLTILMRHTKQPDIEITKTLGNGVQVVNGEFILSLAQGEVVTDGGYTIHAAFVDQQGKLRGLTLSPNSVRFEKFML